MTTTTTQAKTTKDDAKGTARSASRTTKTATRKVARTTRRETRATEQGVVKHTRRVVAAAQKEVDAITATPYRPALFALGVVDRATAGVRGLPSTVISTPGRLRAGIVEVAATAGDWAEQAQRGYTDIAKDGEKLVRAVRRQDSTQRAAHFAERASSRGQAAVKDVEKAVGAGTEATQQAFGKLG